MSTDISKSVQFQRITLRDGFPRTKKGGMYWSSVELNSLNYVTNKQILLVTYKNLKTV